MELAGYHETKRPAPKFYFVIHRQALIKCLNFQVSGLIAGSHESDGGEFHCRHYG